MNAEQRIHPILIELYWHPYGSESAAAKEILKAFGRNRHKRAVEAIASTLRRHLWNDGWKSCIADIVQVINQTSIKRRAA